MGMRLRQLFGVLAFGASVVACAGVIGLGDFEIVPDGADGAVEAGVGQFSEAGVTTADGITISPTLVAIPPANCATPSTATFTIANSGKVQTSFSATVDTPGFTIQDGTGYVAPGSSATVTVIAIGPTNGTLAADVTVTTGTAAVPVHVTYASKGAAVAVDPATLDFGVIHKDVASAPSNVTFTNSGSSDVTVSALTGMTADFSASVPFTIPAGQTATRPFTMTAGTAASAHATVGFTTDQPVCGTAPQLVLQGTRTSQDITISPATVDLGDIRCGMGSDGDPGGGTDAGALPTAVVTISNYGTMTPSFTASPGPSFGFSPSSGTVPAVDSGSNAPGTVPLTVSFSGATNNPTTASTTMSVNVNSQITQITAQARVVGARFSEPSTVTTSGSTATALKLQNQGNVTACVSYTIANDAPGYYHLSAPSEAIAANGTGSATVTYTGVFGGFGGGARGGENATLNVALVACAGASAPAALCGSSLQTITLRSQQ